MTLLELWARGQILLNGAEPANLSTVLALQTQVSIMKEELVQVCYRNLCCCFKFFLFVLLRIVTNSGHFFCVGLLLFSFLRLNQAYHAFR